MNEYHDGRGRFCSGSGAVPCPDPPCEAYDGTNAGGTTQHGRASSPSPRKTVGEAKEHVDGRGGGGAPAKRRINPSPGGGGKITFINDVPGGPSTDHPISASTAAMIEDVAKELGLSININSTTGGMHSSPKSRHYQGQAVDINMINGIPLSPSNPYVSVVQEMFQRHPNIRENFGPSRCAKTDKGKVSPIPKVVSTHRTHIHVSGQE